MPDYDEIVIGAGHKGLPAASVLARNGLSVLCPEKTFGATAGDFASGLMHRCQMWDKRPVPGWVDYRTPTENLFMCGSACHPPPGVTCAPGDNSANEVLKNWGICVAQPAIAARE